MIVSCYRKENVIMVIRSDQFRKYCTDARRTTTFGSFLPMADPTHTPPLRDLSDEALVLRIGETNDRPSFGIIYERYQRRVLARGYDMVDDPVEAQDLSQEVFQKLFKNAAKYKQQSAFAASSKVMNYHVVIDELRKTQRMRLVPLPEDDQASTVLTVNENAIREKHMFKMLHIRLMQCWNCQPPRTRSCN